MLSALRQLAERTVSSRSSIGRSSTGSTPPAAGFGRTAVAVGEVAEHRQLVGEDVGGGAHGFLGIDRAVGFDVQHQLVEVGALLDARGFHRVGDAADRRERRVQHQTADGAGLLVRTATGGGRLVAEAALDLQAHVDRRVLGQVCRSRARDSGSRRCGRS